MLMIEEEKTTEELAAEPTKVVLYKVDLEKIKQYSHEAIAEALAQVFGTIAVELDEDRKSEHMLLDGPLGKFLSLDEEKVDIHEKAMEDL